MSRLGNADRLEFTIALLNNNNNITATGASYII